MSGIGRAGSRRGAALSRWWVWLAIATALVASSTTANGQQPFGATAQRIAAREDALSPVDRGRRQALQRLYASTTAEPLWTTEGRPTRQAEQVIDVIGDVRTRGLDPRDYGADALRAAAAELVRGGGTTDVARLAEFDVSLSRALLRLIGHLHGGRVDPTTIGFDLPNAGQPVDLESWARSASRATDVPATIAKAEPPYAGYAALVRALARYRVLAADTTLRLPRIRLARALRAGDSTDVAPALRRFLAAVGDLDADRALPIGAEAADSAAARRYDATLADAIARFQARHGLEVDSVLGPATLTALRVPLARRVRQIELTLERWRWLPDRPPPRYAVVNIPSFRVYVFENDSAAACPALAMNVIVGQAEGRHDTPVFTGTMREVIFRPYWDVPPNIARKELVPIIRRNPGYMEREQLEIVRGGETDAVVYPPTAANLARVTAGTLRLRQRPGPNNALGLVKFMFPNRYNVYLHGTPAQALFAQARRDFSHGCIRAEDPTSLAEFVLRGQPGWDRAAIEAAMHGTRTMHVTVERPVGVYVLYATVRADGTGMVWFYSDIYGHDARLERVLKSARIASGEGR